MRGGARNAPSVERHAIAAVERPADENAIPRSGAASPGHLAGASPPCGSPSAAWTFRLALQRCRRYRQCWGNTIECIGHHSGLVVARLAGADIDPDDATKMRRLVQLVSGGR